ncbi:MAG: methionyl-tRNA formyltransferase, partial [Oscillospiraceae bacterium]
MKIVFMGTPEFSVPCLQRLIDEKYDVVGVFTQPDKPKGRGYELSPPAVKVCALANNIAVFQPKSMKDGEAL